MTQTLSDDSFEHGATPPAVSDDAALGVVAALHKDVAWADLTDTPIPSRQLGRFLVQRFLGRGGMGMVFEAHDERLGRPVALKLLRRRRDPGQRARARMFREARALARLSHPNVVQIYDTGIIEDCPFIAMELARGETLAQWQERERPPWRECVLRYLDAGRGLAAAHAQGLVHRDFKPHNCIVDEHGLVRVLDFGLAREAALPSSESSTTSNNDSSPALPALTQAGSMVGTVAYMAPEQLRKQPADAHSDQFSFCVSLFEALVGRRPFRADDAEALLAAQQQPPTWPAKKSRGASVPSWLQDVVTRGLDHDPKCRHRDMDALLATLEHGLRRGTRVRTVAAASAVLGLGALAAVMWPQERPCEGLDEAAVSAWGPTERASLQRSIVAVSPSDLAWQRLAARLDPYADEWARQRALACEAHFEERTLGAQGYERRTACLDGRKLHFRALVEALGKADARAVIESPLAAAQLPDLQSCTQTQRLLDGPPPPSDDVVVGVGRQRARLAAARAQGRLGQHRDALSLAHQVVNRAAALGYEPLHAQALAERGWLRLQTRQFDSSDADLSAALTLAEASHDDALTFDILMSLADLSVQIERSTAAEAWVKQARAKLARLGNDPARTMKLRRREGKVALLIRDTAVALDAFAEVLAWVDRAPTEVRLDQITAHLDLALALDAASRHHEAIEHYEAGLAIAGEELGDHINTAYLHLDLADLHARLGNEAEARTHYEQALVVVGKSRSFASPMVVVAEIGLTQLDLSIGDLEAAQAHARRASAAIDASRSGSIAASQRADVLGVLGGVAQYQGDYALAISRYEGALEAWGEVSEADPVWSALLVSNIGECLLSQRKLHAARDRFSAAQAQLEVALPSDDPLLAYPLRGLGETMLELGHPDAATATLTRALALRETEPGDVDNLASIQWALARASSDPAVARTLAHRALEGFGQLGPLGHSRATTVTRWLAGKE